MSGRVVWDGRWVGRHGIARYAHEVATRLNDSYEILKPGRVSPTSPMDPLYLKCVLRLSRADLFASPGFNASFSGHYKQLITVHDLIHLRVDDESSHLKRLYYDRIVLPAILSAGRVLTVSNFSQRELIDWTGLPAEAVIKIGNGCSFAAATLRELDCRRESSEQTVLFVGNPKPHKNLSLVVAALRHMHENVRVVTVGVPNRYVLKLCEAHGVAPRRFEVLMNISDARLRELYLLAACVALPSSYEGFGLSALEGMAVGTPTAYICDAVHEVVGPFGYRAESIMDAEAYAGVLADAMAMDPSVRRGMIERAMTFSWADSTDLLEHQIELMCK